MNRTSDVHENGDAFPAVQIATAETPGDFKLFTVAEVAERLRISQACTYALVETGRLKCYRIGVRRGAIRISEAQIQIFLDSVEQDCSAPAKGHVFMPPPRAKDFSFLPPPS